jgi:hypothetical protein
MSKLFQHEPIRHSYAIDEAKDQSGGRLLLAVMGLSVIVPLLLVSGYLLATHTASPDLVPPTFGLVVLFVWLVSRAFRSFRDRLPEENESVMNFSPLGLLTCICEQAEPDDSVAVRAERRQTCRGCGHSIVAREPARLQAVLSSRDIASQQTKLRKAAVRAKGLDIPTSVENIDQLLDYLDEAPAAPPSGPAATAPVRQLA